MSGKYGIPTYFRPSNTLRQLLVKPKDLVNKEDVVGPVYVSNVKSVMQRAQVIQKNP